MADFTDPNNWTKEYVRSHRGECLFLLKEDNLLVIRYVRQNNYTAAIAGLDRILNGLVTMQNSGCGDFRSFMSMFSMAEGILLTFMGPRGIPLAIDMLKDAKDFAKKPETRKNVDAILTPLQAGESLDAQPDDVVWLLQKMDHQLDAAISDSGASPSRSVSSPNRSVSPPVSGPADREFEAWVENNGWDEEDLERYYKKIRFRRNLYGLCLLLGPLGILILPFWLRAVHITKSIRHRSFAVKQSSLVFFVTMILGLPTLYIYPWIMGKIIVATNWGMGMGDRRAWIPVIAIVVLIAGIILVPAVARDRSDNSSVPAVSDIPGPAITPTWTPTPTSTPTPTPRPTPSVTSGKCGENVTWTLDSDGLLTISGTGPMDDDYNWATYSYPPWYEDRDLITRVVIENGVTSIGLASFFGCGLTSVTIPDTVTSIGHEAFYGCEGLAGVTIPDSVTSIGDHVFAECSSLTSVTIGSGVASIGDGAFYRCSLTSIEVASGNAQYISVDGVLFSSDQTLLHTYSVGKKDRSYSIPPSVTSIGYGAFSGASSLTSVTIPDSVTSIGDAAFESCANLTSVTIPDSVTRLEYRTFWECSSLISATIGSSVTSISSYVFHGCGSLTSVTIPDSLASVGVSSFYGCKKLTDVYYSGSKTQWAQIRIADSNNPLRNAAIHYNS